MEVIDIVEIRHYKAGDTIFHEGEPGDAWFVLYRGTTARLSELPGSTDIAHVHEGIKGILGAPSIRE
jgi:CRP-like cAMP-binding protein